MAKKRPAAVRAALQSRGRTPRGPVKSQGRPKPRRQSPTGPKATPAVGQQPRAVVESAREPAPAAPRKPQYYEAIALYERGVQALQRHDFATAADHFRSVLSRYPEERELTERSTLYLRVCERETERRPPPPPQTAAERIYAATVALNSGDTAAGIEQLRAALEQDAGSDHAHYMLAVALTMASQPEQALEHLRRAIALNPDNRVLARQDPDLDILRLQEGFQAALDTPAEAQARASKSRR